MVVNMITVYKYGISGDDESDTEPIPEQIITTTTNNELSINNDKLLDTEQCKINFYQWNSGYFCPM